MYSWVYGVRLQGHIGTLIALFLSVFVRAGWGVKCHSKMLGTSTQQVVHEINLSCCDGLQLTVTMNPLRGWIHCWGVAVTVKPFCGLPKKLRFHFNIAEPWSGAWLVNVFFLNLSLSPHLNWINETSMNEAILHFIVLYDIEIFTHLLTAYSFSWWMKYKMFAC